MARLSRRSFLRRSAETCVVTALTLAGASPSAPAAAASAVARRNRRGLRSADRALLDELARGAFRFFTEAAHPRSGQVLDRRRADGGPETRRVASIAATGFGLTGLCIADQRGWGGAWRGEGAGAAGVAVPAG